MAFTRGQTQVMYQFLPGAVFEHDQYGFCKISGVELQEKPVNHDAVFNAVADLLFQWPDDTLRGGFADPRQQHNRRLYAIGNPALVRFQPFPSIFECRRCRQVYRLRDLTRRPNAQPRQLPGLSGHSRAASLRSSAQLRASGRAPLSSERLSTARLTVSTIFGHGPRTVGALALWSVRRRRSRTPSNDTL